LKAVVYARYGPPEVLKIEEVERPTPGDNEVLIRVRAVSLNKADLIMMRGKPFVVRLMASGLLRPKRPILGADVAGQVEAVGKAVKRFKPGDEVFGLMHERGGLAEYVCAPEGALVLRPAKVTAEAAAAVPMAALTALYGLRDKGNVQPGQKVLVNGASGGVGTFAVQIAKALGADVTAVCSTSHLDTARSTGADDIIDYTKEDFTLKGGRYDLILGVNGYRSIFAYRRALGPQGTYVMLGGSGGQISQALLLGRLLSRAKGKRMRLLGSWKPKGQDLAFIAELIEMGKVVPVIDKRFPLSQAAEAFRYLDKGHAIGKVIITMEQEGGQ
jgi:NADPH:quinone reductase-like Zn-dependent oxidoreductase